MKMRIIAFPFAGGNKYSFNFLKKSLDANQISFDVLEYPGHGNRIRQPLLTDLNDIVQDAIEQMLRLLENHHGPYMVFGHSMGALVAYQVCSQIAEQGLLEPIRLVVSGSSAPTQKEMERFHDLPMTTFWEKVSEFGGMPKEVLQDEQIKNFFEPILRADFEAIENYQYVPQEKLSLPIDVFYGTTDKIKQEALHAWKQETKGEVNIRPLEGDHFFIYDHQPFFIDYFQELYRAQAIGSFA
ncbi:surfactin synthase thioesterase subunit [Aquimarina sp. MAR_2010_214]|uniref:thioesterase II family protein n=1 Tax=Aquimarina sp. MAR_2010_214 TaxID=1250026 RepID=UPI000C6FD0A4|nr:alpha/beta fold hydrolase [Aquimarina sp. MAR_2010_214]PKV49531.1 surfactin synthase thioesterase subunit [Aquimarina sp. MAR_2010_214]